LWCTRSLVEMSVREREMWRGSYGHDPFVSCRGAREKERWSPCGFPRKSEGGSGRALAREGRTMLQVVQERGRVQGLSSGWLGVRGRDAT
jgi:hypothetical protein